MRGERVLLRDYPITFWLMGTAAIVAGILLHESIGVRVALALPGICGVGLGSILTLAFDPHRRTLALRYWSLFRRSIRVLPFADVCGVTVREDHGEGNFRVELRLWSGEVIPLRDWYSPGKRGHMRVARKLEALLASDAAARLTTS